MLLDRLIDEFEREATPGSANAVRAVLLTEPIPAGDEWLDARARRAERERLRLAERLAAFAHRLATHPANELTAAEGQRLRSALQHYRQRLHDLAYDDVGMELGGSE